MYNKKKWQQVVGKMEALLKKEMSEEITLKGARFNDENCTVKFEIATVTSEGTPVTKERRDFIKYAESFYGIPGDMIDKTFIDRGCEYTITGMKIRSCKFPIIAKKSDGKSFVFKAKLVKDALGILEEV